MRWQPKQSAWYYRLDVTIKTWSVTILVISTANTVSAISTILEIYLLDHLFPYESTGYSLVYQILYY